MCTYVQVSAVLHANIFMRYKLYIFRYVFLIAVVVVLVVCVVCVVFVVVVDSPVKGSVLWLQCNAL